MVRQKLNIRFHNPNPVAESSDRIAQIFIQASHLKLEKLLEAYASGVVSGEEESSSLARKSIFSETNTPMICRL